MQCFPPIVRRTFASHVRPLIAIIGMLGADFAGFHTIVVANQHSNASINVTPVHRQEKASPPKLDRVIEDHKQQALSVLHRIIDQAQDIADVEVQATVLSSAISLLWSYEQQYAASSFQRSVDRLLDKYSADDTTPAQRLKLSNAIKQLISNVAPRDPALAEEALGHYGKAMTRESTDNNTGLSPKEKLSIAKATLDFDAKQSVALAQAILQTGVPTSFPDYLFQLKDRDPDASNVLFGTALSQLANNPLYSPVHATI